MGSSHPIRIQSMANTPTADIRASVEQCLRIIKAGADYVRFTIPSLADVQAIASIKQALLKQDCLTPIIADVHFNAEVALRVADVADKVRINPGNFADTKKFESIVYTGEAYRLELSRIRDRFLPLLDKCRNRGIAIRIGVNHGSLSDRIMSRYGDTPEGMAESAMEFLRICRDAHFDQVVVSMKASNIRVMVQANRLVVRMMDAEDMYFPLHLGVTEAGEGEDGRIKSAAGIGALLNEGFGDTIRVSLTEEPEAEIPVARRLVEHISEIALQNRLPGWGQCSPNVQGFTRRQTRVVGNIGGNHVPVVIGTDSAADYTWLQAGLCQVLHCNHNQQPASSVNFTEATLETLDSIFINTLQANAEALLVYRCTQADVQAELRILRAMLEENHCDIPVVIRFEGNEPTLESFQVKTAAALGGTFIDGFGDGIWLSNKTELSGRDIISTAFGILQACRARITRTEYISCPSCGRTNFNLMETLARIKAATSHLKGIKIGIMGCIVNGPGEMADADYGYVGSGKGKVTLYKAKKVISRGIPEDNAVEHLIALMKQEGDWKEP